MEHPWVLFDGGTIPVSRLCDHDLQITLGPILVQKFCSFERSRSFENFLTKPITKIFKGPFKEANFCTRIGPRIGIVLIQMRWDEERGTLKQQISRTDGRTRTGQRGRDGQTSFPRTRALNRGTGRKVLMNEGIDEGGRGLKWSVRQSLFAFLKALRARDPEILTIS